LFFFVAIELQKPAAEAGRVKKGRKYCISSMGRSERKQSMNRYTQWLKVYDTKTSPYEINELKELCLLARKQLLISSTILLPFTGIKGKQASSSAENYQR